MITTWVLILTLVGDSYLSVSTTSIPGFKDASSCTLAGVEWKNHITSSHKFVSPSFVCVPTYVEPRVK